MAYRRPYKTSSRQGRQEIKDFLVSNGFSVKTDFDALVILEKTFAAGFTAKAVLSRSALEVQTSMRSGESILSDISSLPWEEADTLLPAQAVTRLLNTSRNGFFTKLRERNKNAKQQS